MPWSVKRCHTFHRIGSDATLMTIRVAVASYTHLILLIKSVSLGHTYDSNTISNRMVFSQGYFSWNYQPLFVKCFDYYSRAWGICEPSVMVQSCWLLPMIISLLLGFVTRVVHQTPIMCLGLCREVYHAHAISLNNSPPACCWCLILGFCFEFGSHSHSNATLPSAL